MLKFDRYFRIYIAIDTNHVANIIDLSYRRFEMKNRKRKEKLTQRESEKREDRLKVSHWRS